MIAPRARPLLNIICLAILVDIASAQQPPRDIGAPQAGTASIAGVIQVDDEARIRLAHASVRLTGAGLGPGLVAVTDEGGRFQFANLPAGRFTLTASKSAYLEMAYGQRVPGRGTGVPISVQDGQQIADLTLRLSRGAVIAGAVHDARGRPVANAPIFVMEYRTVNGRRVLWSLGRHGWPPTDSRGRYRAYGLPPGTYIVSAYPSGDYRWLPADGGPYDPGGVVGGGGESLAREVSPAEIQWALQQLQNPSRPLDPLAGSPASPAGRGQTVAVAPTFFPGTPDFESAQTITVARSEERSGIDFVLTSQATARITAQIVGPDGQPAKGVFVSFSAASSSSGRPSADGRFSMTDLAPGRYTLHAETTDGTMWARREFLVNGEDFTDVILTLEPSLTFSGRVVFDGTSLTPPTDLTDVSLALRQDGSFRLVRLPVKADGTFSVGTMPGEYYLIQPGGGHAWSIGSVVVRGSDVTDLPVSLKPGDNLSNIVVTFTDRHAELSGTLVDADGRPASGYHVVVFSENRQYWAPSARRPASIVRTATDGAFRVVGLRPGSYHIVAVTEIDQQDIDEQLLSQLAAAATTLTLKDGEKRVQNLKFAGGQ